MFEYHHLIHDLETLLIMQILDFDIVAVICILINIKENYVLYFDLKNQIIPFGYETSENT